MEYQIIVSDIWYRFIEDGSKCYEGRRAIGIFNQIRAGDILILINKEDRNLTCRKRVNKVYKFTTFQEALETLDMQKILPSIQTVQEGVNIYSKFVSLPTQIKDGVYMFELIDENFFSKTI